MITVPAATVEQSPPVHLPEPMASWKGAHIGEKLRFLGQHMLKFVWSFILGNVGWYVWVATYFILTQNPWVKPHWDNLLPYAWWTPVRHFLRDGGEFLLAATFVWLMLTNPFKKRFRDKPSWYERLLKAIGGWQYVVALPLVFIVALPGIALVYLLAQVAGSYEHAHHLSHALVTGVNYFQSHAPKFAGVAGGLFFGRRVFNAVAYNAQVEVARLMHEMGRRPRWPLPATFRGVYTAEAETSHQKRGPVASRLIIISLLVGVGLAVYGYYIFTHIAHG